MSLDVYSLHRTSFRAAFSAATNFFPMALELHIMRSDFFIQIFRSRIFRHPCYCPLLRSHNSGASQARVRNVSWMFLFWNGNAICRRFWNWLEFCLYYEWCGLLLLISTGKLEMLLGERFTRRKMFFVCCR